MLKVCVFGGGAIGCYIVGHLARAGLCDVSVVARGSVLLAIREDGVRVVTPAGEFRVGVRATDDPASLGMQDYVFITVKTHQIEAALPGIRALVGPDTVLIPPTTGIPYYFFHGFPGALDGRRLAKIDPADAQWRSMPPAQVMAAVVWIGAHTVRPGYVQQDGAAAGLPIGELDGQSSNRARVLSDLLERSGIRAPIRDNIRGEIWIKFVNSLCWNPVAVLTLARMGEIGESAPVVDVVATMMREVDTLGAALGVQLPQPPEKRIAVTLQASRHKMSMLQDLEHGRRLELAPLQKSLASIQELTGLPTPTVDCVLALADLRARQTLAP